MSGKRMTVYQAALPHPGQTLDVEWVPDAEWDRHWAIVFSGVSCRQELRRCASYTEARRAATEQAARVCAREEVSA